MGAFIGGQYEVDPKLYIVYVTNLELMPGFLYYYIILINNEKCKSRTIDKKPYDDLYGITSGP